MRNMIALPAAARLRGRNVLAVTDLGADELASLLALAQTLKAAAASSSPCCAARRW